jgi:hypothetical protein
MSLEQEWREAVARHQVGVKNVMLAEYRCRKKGCLMLRIWQTPNGPEFFAPPAGLPDWYATAGQLHWPNFDQNDPGGKTGPRAGLLSNPTFDGLWLWLLCDHLRGVLWTSDIRRDFEGRTPGKPVRINLPRDTPGQPHPREAL